MSDTISYYDGHAEVFSEDTGDVDFADVIGPDEYHERVINNAFTNRMIRHCVESALGLKQIFADDPGMMDGLMKKLDYEKDWALLSRMCRIVSNPIGERCNSSRMLCGVNLWSSTSSARNIESIALASFIIPPFPEISSVFPPVRWRASTAPRRRRPVKKPSPF